MSHRIQFKHSRRQVIAQANETVLAAAIRAGIQVDYACNNGHCGQCLARLRRGDIRRIAHSDYALSASEKRNKGFLMCIHEACSDLRLEAHTVSHADLLPQRLAARISRIRHLDEGRVAQLIVRLPRQKRLHFFAGQYVFLGAKSCPDAACSIASCPCDISCLEFHLDRQGHAALSDYVFSSARIGDKLTVKGPFGRFTLPEEIERPIVFVAADLGFAAVKSLLEHLLARELDVPVYLYRLSSPSKTFYLENLCRSWQDAFDNFTYRELAAAKASDYAEAIVAAVDGLRTQQAVDVYLSAEQDALDAVVRPLRAREKVRLHAEPVRLSPPSAKGLRAAL